MQKTFLKTVARSVRANRARLLSVAVIILLGVAFVSGLGTLSPSILHSFSEDLRAANVSDCIAVREEGIGLTLLPKILSVNMTESLKAVE